MKKLLIVIALIITSSLQTLAFEDCVITTNGKLTDISIEDNTLVNVYPLITLKNDKNTLIVQPLKTGKTRFCVLKNGKDIVMFNVEIEETKTSISEVKGFNILSIDNPPGLFEIDLPPILKEEVN